MDNGKLTAKVQGLGHRCALSRVHFPLFRPALLKKGVWLYSTRLDRRLVGCRRDGEGYKRPVRNSSPRTNVKERP